MFFFKYIFLIYKNKVIIFVISTNQPLNNWK